MSATSPRARHTIDLGGTRWAFDDLKTLLARATPLRSGDQLAGLAADTAVERMAAQMLLADLPLSTFLDEAVVPYEDCEVTRAIIDDHDPSDEGLEVRSKRVDLVNCEAAHGSMSVPF